MPQQNQAARKVKHSKEVFSVTLLADNQGRNFCNQARGNYFEAVMSEVSESGAGEHRELPSRPRWKWPASLHLPRGAFDANGLLKTMAICHGHDLGFFAAFGFTNFQAPFFAGAKLASMNASRTSIGKGSRTFHW
jgi:hypothetical protein